VKASATALDAVPLIPENPVRGKSSDTLELDKGHSRPVTASGRDSFRSGKVRITVNRVLPSDEKYLLEPDTPSQRKRLGPQKPPTVAARSRGAGLLNNLAAVGVGKAVGSRLVGDEWGLWGIPRESRRQSKQDKGKVSHIPLYPHPQMI
jgi:hypothetical protein